MDRRDDVLVTIVITHWSFGNHGYCSCWPSGPSLGIYIKTTFGGLADYDTDLAIYFCLYMNETFNVQMC